MRMTEILQLAQSSRTSDIHIAPGNPLMLRIDGTLVPQGDVPYYRGVVERGASVYLCEYDLEKRKRDLASLEKEVGGDGIPTDTSHLDKVDVNEGINSVIYRQINKSNDAAYINYLVYPAIIFTISIIVAIIVRVFSLS